MVYALLIQQLLFARAMPGGVQLRMERNVELACLAFILVQLEIA